MVSLSKYLRAFEHLNYLPVRIPLNLLRHSKSNLNRYRIQQCKQRTGRNYSKRKAVSDFRIQFKNAFCSLLNF